MSDTRGMVAGDLADDLPNLIALSVLAFAALTPEQQREHRRAQRKSWVVGELMLSYPDMTRERAEKLYEDMQP